MGNFNKQADYSTENSLSGEQSDVSHKIPNCIGDTAAAEMRAAYKVGFKDGATIMQEIQD